MAASHNNASHIYRRQLSTRRMIELIYDGLFSCALYGHALLLTVRFIVVRFHHTRYEVT